MARGAGGARSVASAVFEPFCPWKWLLLLVAVKCSEATSDLNKPANFTAQHGPDVRLAAAASSGLEEVTVFTLDYDYVQIPYEVTLWILLASLAKIGKSQTPGCARCFPHEMLYVETPCRKRREPSGL